MHPARPFRSLLIQKNINYFQFFVVNKGVFDATFEPKDSTQNMMINLYTVAGGKEGDLQAMKEIVNDTGKTVTGCEWVVVNKSVPIFENTNYKTTIGTLKFGCIPW